MSELKLRPPMEKPESGPPRPFALLRVKRTGPTQEEKSKHRPEGRPLQPRERRPPQKAAATKAGKSGEEDLRFGFDDEEGVGVGMAVGAELLEGVVEGGSEDGEDYGSVVAANEVEAALLLNEF